MRTATATRQNGHDAHHGVGLAEPQCPYCGQPISRKAFKDIRSRIETEERARIAKIEQTLKTRFARERQEAAVATQQAIEKAKKDAAVQVEQAKREVAARAASIRQEATKSATAALAPKIAEAVAAEKQRALGERLALEQQLAAMQRRLEAKPPHQVGEPAEQDLHLRIAQLL